MQKKHKNFYNGSNKPETDGYKILDVKKLFSEYCSYVASGKNDLLTPLNIEKILSPKNGFKIRQLATDKSVIKLDNIIIKFAEKLKEANLNEKPTLDLLSDEGFVKDCHDFMTSTFNGHKLNATFKKSDLIQSIAKGVGISEKELDSDPKYNLVKQHFKNCLDTEIPKTELNNFLNRTIVGKLIKNLLEKVGWKGF